jgi:hypothetical protein
MPIFSLILNTFSKSLIKTKNLKKTVSFAAILLMVLACFVSVGMASTFNSDQLSFAPQIVCSAFSGNGTLFAGDNNYTFYRSDDNGTSFNLAYKFPAQTNSTSGFAGYTMMLFVDSNNHIFVSIPTTNRLYRSVDFGSTFTEVLKTNSTINDGFYVAMTEDQSGNLYTSTYSNNDSNYPQTFKSTDGGATWKTIITCQVVHMHNVKVNPNNGYLYVICGEYGDNIHGNVDAERVFRSKDGGATWKILIERNTTSPKIYATMQFDGNYVYLGSDMAFTTNFIDRFYDDGVIGMYLNGTGTLAAVQRVYTSPASDGALPFISAIRFNQSLVFSSTVEFTVGTARIISSADGLTWSTIKAVNYTSVQHHCNMLTSNPNDVLVGSDGVNANYRIANIPDPVVTSTPTPSYSPSPTPTITSISIIPSATPKPSTTPNPTATPSTEPSATPTATPTSPAPTAQTQSIFNFDVSAAIIIVAVVIIIAGSITVIRKSRNRKP